MSYSKSGQFWHRNLTYAFRASLVVVLVLFLGTADLSAESISDDFTAGLSSSLWGEYVNPGSYDPWSVSVPEGTGYLRISKPADPGQLNASLNRGVVSNFQLLGDYTVTVDFDLATFPHPGDGYNEGLLGVQAVSQSSWFAVLKFSIDSGSSSYREYFEGYSVPPSTPFGATEDNSRTGTFKIQRVGTQVSAFVDHGDGMELLGSVTGSAFSGPVRVYMLGSQVVRGATGERPFCELDVRFDNFQATADQVVPEPATATLLVLGSGAFALFRRRRMKA